MAKFAKQQLCKLEQPHLPGKNQSQLTSQHQHWKHYSKDAWRWLGWNAPDENGMINRYPMDYFIDSLDEP
ncbi:MAG: hypothetical protein K0U68_11255 [Gammaproteobacteria bacterium]|nr:hypothetical protein [Gammaproteobacteria bacterium]